MLANRCLYGLRKLMRSKLISRKSKMRLYHQQIMPVLLYGSESWALKDSDEKLLAVFERRILRIIYGPICEEGEWRIRYNNDHLYQHPSVVRKLRTRSLQWAGHVQRMEENVPARKCFSTNQKKRERIASNH